MYKRRLQAATGLLVTTLSLGVIAADEQSLPGEEVDGSGAAKQCLNDLQSFDDTLEKVGFGVLPPGRYDENPPFGYYLWGVQATPRQKLRSLRDAAYVYSLDGNEEECQRVLASMHKVYQEHQKLVGDEADDPQVTEAWRRAHLERANPIMQMDHLMRAEVLLGAKVRNVQDDKLGEIEDLVLTPKERRIEYVLVSRGGFLGFGKQLVAVRWQDLHATEDHELYVLDVSKEAMENAPKVDRKNFANTADTKWRRELSDYWESVINSK